MAKRGGFPGGMMPGNMNNLMKQAQKMQKQMEETTKTLEDKVYESSVGGGVVTAKVSGKKELMEIKLDPEVVDPDDIETLEWDLEDCRSNGSLWRRSKQTYRRAGKTPRNRLQDGSETGVSHNQYA